MMEGGNIGMIGQRLAVPNLPTFQDSVIPSV